jgi:hypothetical protein
MKPRPNEDQVASTRRVLTETGLDDSALAAINAGNCGIDRARRRP